MILIGGMLPIEDVTDNSYKDHFGKRGLVFFEERGLRYVHYPTSDIIIESLTDLLFLLDMYGSMCHICLMYDVMQLSQLGLSDFLVAYICKVRFSYCSGSD